MAVLAWGAIGAGTVLAGRPLAIAGRPVGAALICFGALCLTASPAMADQSIPAADNGTVACVASAKDLTRISLAGDQFASVSKISTGNPAEGDKVRFTFNLPDGSSETIELTATSTVPPPPGSFAIGADATATTANLQARLDDAVKTLAGTSLVAASAIAASNNFFDSPPQRVDLTPPATATTATALRDGTAADTVIWYTGEDAQGPTDSARGTAVAQVDQAISVQYGARANEPAFRAMLQQIAVYAAVTTSSGDPNANGQVTALSQRVALNLSPQQGAQTIQDIQTEFAGAQTAIKASTDRQAQIKTMTQTMLDSIEGVNQDEVATKILALQTSLTASYQTTAMLYQINLTKYL